MKKSIVLWFLYCFGTLLIAMWLVSCEKQTQPDKQVFEYITEAEWKKGGNGNGGNPHGGGNGNLPPCSTVQVVHDQPADWNITADTNNCGSIIIRWDAQPGFVGGSNIGGYTAEGKYFLAIHEVDALGNYIPQTSACAGIGVTTNSLFYQYGWGCSMFPGRKLYEVKIEWLHVDTIGCVNTWKHSLPEVVTTGTLGIWNCN